MDNFENLLTPPPDGIPVPAVPPVPLPEAPGEMPVAPPPGGEDLVEVTGDKLEVIRAYWDDERFGSIDRTLVRPAVLERLRHAAAALPAGYSITVLDAWRSSELQNWLYNQTMAGTGVAAGFVSPPADPPAPHSTGGAVDVTLAWNGTALALGTGFDEFTAEAAPGAFEEIPGAIRDLRRMLRSVMTAAGFCGHHLEWWHFEWGTRRWAAVTGNEVEFGAIRPAV